MQPNQPSKTAFSVAAHRAAHQLLDVPPVFPDALALQVIGPEASELLRTNPAYFEKQPYASYLRAFLAVRSRVAEEALNSSISQGTRQYVVLGAGLDTYAYRQGRGTAGLRIFEVDFPITQNWKRETLQAVGLAHPANLAFVPIDFERDDLNQSLVAAGFDRAAPAFFSWLGVTPYLGDDAIWNTLNDVVSMARGGGGIAFDYLVQLSRLTAQGQESITRAAERVARIGEPWRTFFDPAILSQRLAAMGFENVEDLGPEILNQRYFENQADGLRVGSAGHIMVARRNPL